MTSLTPTDAGDPSPTPSPSPLFLTPPSSTRTAPRETPSEPTSSDPSPAPSLDQDAADAYDLSDRGAPSSTPSPDKAPARPKIAALRATMRQVVRTAGGIVNVVVPRLVTRNPAETIHQVWVPDYEDEQAIAEPLARIAARRAPSGMTDNPDAVDLAALALALVDYLRKSLAARADVLPETYVSGTVDGDGSAPADSTAAVDATTDVGPGQYAGAPGFGS